MKLIGLGKKKQEYERLLQWQNFLFARDGHDPLDELVVSKEDLQKYTRNDVMRYLQIIKDCKKAVSETVNPDVFFSRLNLMVARTEDLRQYEPYVEINDKTPTALHFEVVEQYQEMVRKFLLRYYSDIFEKAKAMKTAKGRVNKFHQWYDSLQEYYCFMNEENIQFVESEHRLQTKALDP